MKVQQWGKSNQQGRAARLQPQHAQRQRYPVPTRQAQAPRAFAPYLLRAEAPSLVRQRPWQRARLPASRFPAHSTTHLEHHRLPPHFYGTVVLSKPTELFLTMEEESSSGAYEPNPVRRQSSGYRATRTQVWADHMQPRRFRSWFIVQAMGQEASWGLLCPPGAAEGLSVPRCVACKARKESSSARPVLVDEHCGDVAVGDPAEVKLGSSLQGSCFKFLPAQHRPGSCRSWEGKHGFLPATAGSRPAGLGHGTAAWAAAFPPPAPPKGLEMGE